MAQQILHHIAQQIQTSVFFSVMIDDSSNKEQVVLAFRWFGEDLVAHEDLYLTDSITSAALVAIIEDNILRINIKLEHCHGQCYDGASTMSGAKNGVATVIASKESRAHCYGHALNLGVGDTVPAYEISFGCDGRNIQAHQAIT